MCGIVGVINGKSVIEPLIDGLKTLEYRGYDSSGVAILRAGEIVRRRAPGKLDNLMGELSHSPIDGPVGIGHTRWATHGVANITNAHPHVSDGLAVVHNGIIENFAELRAELEADGVEFESETDSEVIPKLIGQLMTEGRGPVEALTTAVNRLEGQYAIVAMSEAMPGKLIATRKDCPLSVAVNDKEVLIASDMLAFGDRVDKVAHLENGELAIVDRQEIALLDDNGNRRPLNLWPNQSENFSASKAGYRHFMLKEIHEQPLAIAQTLNRFRSCQEHGISDLSDDLVSASSLEVIACGTSLYAGMIGRSWFESIAGIPTICEAASEHRYRAAPARCSGANLYISQSGETADTLACLRHAKDSSEQTTAIVNVPTSAMAREADLTITTTAGPEIGVASTKAFTAQLATLLVLARSLSDRRGQLSQECGDGIDRELQLLPQRVELALAVEDDTRKVAEAIRDASSALFVGRGISYALALEGALKLKEISYIHAEGVAAGELKHGPLALVDESMPVFVIAPPDATQIKTASNLEEIAARHGRIVLLSDAAGIEAFGPKAWKTIEMPKCGPWTTPIVYAVALQLIAYHTALLRGNDIDQPRNLAKSVTVE
jgi:glucosamine--fructose-6-phosphate aminotransferase (isomerizing)